MRMRHRKWVKNLFRKKSSLYLFIPFFDRRCRCHLVFLSLQQLPSFALHCSIHSFARSFGIKLDNRHYFKSMIVEDKKQQSCRHSVVGFRGGSCCIIVVVVWAKAAARAKARDKARSGYEVDPATERTTLVDGVFLPLTCSLSLSIYLTNSDTSLSWPSGARCESCSKQLTDCLHRHRNRQRLSQSISLSLLRFLSNSS